MKVKILSCRSGSPRWTIGILYMPLKHCFAGSNPAKCMEVCLSGVVFVGIGTRSVERLGQPEALGLQRQRSAVQFTFSPIPVTKILNLRIGATRRLRLKCDGKRAETRFRLSAKRTSPFKSAGCQFSRLLAAEVCASAVVILDTPCSEVVWRVLATHSIRQFPPYFRSLASPCAITFQLDSARPWDRKAYATRNTIRRSSQQPLQYWAHGCQSH
jgi:hypothetical protein